MRCLHVVQTLNQDTNAHSLLKSLAGLHTWWVKSVICFKWPPNGFPFPGGTEQEVSDAWHPDPTVCGDVHLHQRSDGVYEKLAPTGPLRHHPHYLQASYAGGLHDPSFHWCGLRLQVRLWWRCDVKTVTVCSWGSVIQQHGLVFRLSDRNVIFTYLTIIRSLETLQGKREHSCSLTVSDTGGWIISKESTQMSVLGNGDYYVHIKSLIKLHPSPTAFLGQRFCLARSSKLVSPTSVVSMKHNVISLVFQFADNKI